VCECVCVRVYVCLCMCVYVCAHMKGPAGAQSADVNAVDKLDRYGVCV